MSVIKPNELKEWFYKNYSCLVNLFLYIIEANLNSYDKIRKFCLHINFKLIYTLMLWKLEA